MDVLMGMRKTTQRFKPIILCEVHGTNKDFCAFRHKILRPLGYTVTTLNRERVTDHPLRLVHTIALCEDHYF